MVFILLQHNAIIRRTCYNERRDQVLYNSTYRPHVLETCLLFLRDHFMLNCIFCLITWHWPVAESLGRYNVTTEQQRNSHHNKNETECPEAKYLTSKSFLLINSRSSHMFKRNGTLRERNESNRKRERLNLKELNKLTLQLLLTRGFSESGRVSNTSLLGNGVFVWG